MNFEAEFYKDVAEKKRVARGIHNRASRTKGFKGAVTFPSDYLKGKEKKEYCGNGKVETYMLIPNYTEFKQLGPDDRKKVLECLINKYDRKQIAKEWGLAKGSIDAMVHSLGLAKPKSKQEKPEKEQAKPVHTSKGALLQLDATMIGGVHEATLRFREMIAMLDEYQTYTITFSITEVEVANDKKR